MPVKECGRAPSVRRWYEENRGTEVSISPKVCPAGQGSTFKTQAGRRGSGINTGTGRNILRNAGRAAIGCAVGSWRSAASPRRRAIVTCGDSLRRGGFSSGVNAKPSDPVNESPIPVGGKSLAHNVRDRTPTYAGGRGTRSSVRLQDEGEGVEDWDIVCGLTAFGWLPLCEGCRVRGFSRPPKRATVRPAQTAATPNAALLFQAVQI